MSNPILLSDEESVGEEVPETPLSSLAKYRSLPDPGRVPSLVVIEDDPTPPCKSLKNYSDSSIVIELPETPASENALAVASFVTLNYQSIALSRCNSGALCFDSIENELRERQVAETQVGDPMVAGECNDVDSSFSPSPLRFLGAIGNRKPLTTAETNSSTSIDVNEEETTESRIESKQHELIDKKNSKEERDRMRKELKLKRKLDKLQKAARKDEEKLQKKAETQKKKWETGKFALKSIVAEIDTKVAEQGSVGGFLLTKFSEKSIGYRIVSNTIDRSIVWQMRVPEEFSGVVASEVRYVLVLHEAEEFCNLVSKDLLADHIARVKQTYPSHTVCYLTNRLTAYVNKRERESYKTGKMEDCWRWQHIDEAMSLLTTHYDNVHYRHCRDEAEVAEHVVGLTCSLASCQYRFIFARGFCQLCIVYLRAKLTKLSVNANGLVVPNDCVDRSIIKKNAWLKALVAIPKVQPRFAMAIWKKYPTMKSLLIEYMDADKSVYEKEFLLRDLTVDGLTGSDRRVGAICSKRIYRILMASSGDMLTDDVEDGADQFLSHV